MVSFSASLYSARLCVARRPFHKITTDVSRDGIVRCVSGAPTAQTRGPHADVVYDVTPSILNYEARPRTVAGFRCAAPPRVGGAFRRRSAVATLLASATTKAQRRRMFPLRCAARPSAGTRARLWNATAKIYAPQIRGSHVRRRSCPKPPEPMGPWCRLGYAGPVRLPKWFRFQHVCVVQDCASRVERPVKSLRSFPGSVRSDERCTPIASSGCVYCGAPPTAQTPRSPCGRRLRCTTIRK